MFTFIICVRLFSGKKRVIKNIFLNYFGYFWILNLFKLGEPGMQDIAGEAEMNS